jgi:hypothetical protein
VGTESPSPPYIRVVTESPLEDLWSYYRRFEVVAALRNLVPTGWPDENAEAVRHCVRQAREYFRSARTAPLLTRPVLLYYGQVSLAKLLLLLHPSEPHTMEQIETIERQGHGLRQHDAEPSEGAGYALEAGHVRVVADTPKGGTPRPRGLFPHLARVVCPAGASLWLGQSIEIKELLRAVPQLDLVMRQAFGEGHGYTGLFVGHEKHPDGSACLPVWQHPGGPDSAEDAQRRVSYLDAATNTFTARQEEHFPFEMTVDPEELYTHTVREELANHESVLSPAVCGERLDSILAAYMLLYALSIVARYKPHRWAYILEGHESPLLPVLERLMTICERWWPNLLLNHLTRSWVTFAPPAYFG